MAGGYFMGPPATRRRRGPRAPRGRFVLGLLLIVAGFGVAAVVAATRIDQTTRHKQIGTGYVVDSRLVGRRLQQRAIVPRGGGRGRGLLVLLQGRGDRPGDDFSDAMTAELKRLGSRAPVVVEVDGGQHSYYHDRADGRWGSYVVREAIPEAVRRFGTDPKRVAIGGMSMGGFGALDLARLHPGRFCAVGGHSPALWRRARDTAPGAFDNARDFARHDVYGTVLRRPRAYATEHLWIDVGRGDPFRAVDSALARRLLARHRDVSFHVWPGGHGGAYFDAHVAGYLRFYARALQRC
ncbi:MAG: hypothetical protein QOJ07_1665 [Thermoleophilaceae bacterium]|jgi:predicted esterase|nr:hypothetical protein [Thermoleophilaceae bacterium]